MKKYFLFFIIFLLCGRAESATIPSSIYPESSVTHPISSLQYFSSLSIKDVQKLTGRKLKLKEKIAFKIFQGKIKKEFAKQKTGEKKDKGQTAMILGIIGLAALFIPYAGILISLVCTVLALVLGYQAKKENPDNSKAKTAIILGWIAVGLYVLTIAIVAVILATWVR